MTLQQLDGRSVRQNDVGPIMQWLEGSHCIEVTGISNVGKSSLMRVLSLPDVWLQHLGDEGTSFLPVYIDCNRMLEMTEQGFYELVLRCLQESSPELAANQAIQNAYEALVAPANEFQVLLSFSNGLTEALNKTGYKIILLFDEFDEPFQRIDTRVFLNLRAKKDRHGTRLVYVTATVKPLAALRPGDHSGEFGELFTHHRFHLAPLIRNEVERLMRSFAASNGIVLDKEDIDFAFKWTGGHPGYLECVCRIIGQTIASAGRPGGSREEQFVFRRGLIEQFREDHSLKTEGEKIWNRCSTDQQESMRLLFSGMEPDSATMALLLRSHVIVQEQEQFRPFCRLFAEYVSSHQARVGPGGGILLDAESGEVMVDGRQVSLTALEYRLLNLLYENENRIVGKYEIVEGVWGDEGLLEVDDARIEKLVSRLRQKVESDPANPAYIVTVRGRGYRLITT